MNFSIEIKGKTGIWGCYGKRLFDITVSVLALLVLSPLLLIISALIKLESPGGAIYGGIRTGLFGRMFKILKFRTMIIDAEKRGGFSTAYNDPRLTQVGRILRKFKIDEFPQFWNVLAGEMSLVGPRPQVPSYTDRYTEEEKIILSVRPGITDFSSIHFSNLDKILGDDDVDAKYLREVEPVKNRLRILYVKEISFLTDMQILFWTALTLFGVRKRWNI